MIYDANEQKGISISIETSYHQNALRFKSFVQSKMIMLILMTFMIPLGMAYFAQKHFTGSHNKKVNRSLSTSISIPLDDDLDVDVDDSDTANHSNGTASSSNHSADHVFPSSSRGLTTPLSPIPESPARSRTRTTAGETATTRFVTSSSSTGNVNGNASSSTIDQGNPSRSIPPITTTNTKNKYKTQASTSTSASTSVIIQGPYQPQEIKFCVTKPPSKHIPVLHTGTKYKSIKRQLVINMNMSHAIQTSSNVSVNGRDRKMTTTWEIRKPKSFYKAKEMLVTDDTVTANATASGSGNHFTNTNISTIASPNASTNASIHTNTNTNTNSNASRVNFTFTSNSNSYLQQEQVQGVNPDSSIVWDEAEPNQIFPLDCIQNVSAHVPDKCATVEITYVKNSRMPGSKSTSAASKKASASASDSKSKGASTKTTQSSSLLDDLMDNRVTLENWKTHSNIHDFFSSISLTGASAPASDSSADHYEYDHDNDSWGEDDDSGYHFDDQSSMLGSLVSVSQGVGNAHANENQVISKSRKKERASSKSKSKSRSKVETMEFTFDSEFDAGAFQTLFLAMRMVGSEIWNMYSALELVHKSSEAYDGSAYGNGNKNEDVRSNHVSHDGHPRGMGGSGNNHGSDSDTGNVGGGGVALDDVQRCLGTLPFVGKQIDKLYAHINENVKSNSTGSAKLSSVSTLHSLSSLDSFNEDNNDSGVANIRRAKDGDGDTAVSASSSSTSTTQGRSELYVSKRSVLGIVDFFQLFIPTILHGTPYATPVAESESAISSDIDLDGIEKHQARVTQLITIRQRAAMAAERVRAYVNAMKVAQEGWDIGVNMKVSSPSPTPTVDAGGWQEVQPQSTCRKRLSFDHDEWNMSHDRSSENEYYDPISIQMPSRDCQAAYAVVGYHTIRLSGRMMRSFDADALESINPVELIPSLRKVMEQNPQNNFFLSAFLHKKERLMSVFLFVKWLPHGIDDLFDRALDDYTNGSDDARNENLQLSVACASKSKSILSSIVGNKSEEHTTRKQMPLVKFTTGITHFRGSHCLPSDSRFTLPSNYLAVLVQVDKLPRPIGKVISSLVPLNGVSTDIVDIKFQFKNSTRSVGLVRVVHLNSKSIIPFQERSIEYSRSSSLSDVSDINTDENDIDTIDTQQDLDTLKDILSEITVPSRNVGRLLGTNRNMQTGDYTIDVQILHLFDSDSDIKRHYIAAKKDLKEAAIRITKCAAFRGLTFPIDTRLCRVELNSGQFFQQGIDLDGNPVFYFRNYCCGLWRRDTNVSILAVLYRLESTFTKLSKVNPAFKCTLVVLMSKPSESRIDSTSLTNHVTEITDENRMEESSAEDTISKKSKELHVHTNFQFVQRLLEIVSQNYPERLNRALVIPAGGWEKILGTHGLRRYVNASNTRKKITILDDEKDLEDFIAKEQLIDLAGGLAQMMYFNEH